MVLLWRNAGVGLRHGPTLISLDKVGEIKRPRCCSTSALGGVRVLAKLPQILLAVLLFVVEATNIRHTPYVASFARFHEKCAGRSIRVAGCPPAPCPQPARSAVIHHEIPGRRHRRR
jgi:hypothetical protein